MLGTNTIADLGTLGGDISWGYGINDSGQVIGASTIDHSNAITHAFRYSSGVMQDLGTLGGVRSNARGINNFGDVTGYSETPTGANHAYLYSGGVMHDLGTLGGGGSIGASVNDLGEVTGWSTTASGATHAFLYSGGVMHDLGDLGFPDSVGLGINNSGEVTGVSQTNIDGFPNHAFIYSAGSGMVDLGTLAGGQRSQGNAINSFGDVTGGSDLPGSGGHAFLYSQGTMTDLGALGVPPDYASFGFDAGSEAAEGLGINDHGQVTGMDDVGDSLDRAFVYTNGRMFDLNTLIPLNSGCSLYAGRGINNSGQVTGYGNLNGQLHAFVVTLAPHSDVDSDGIEDIVDTLPQKISNDFSDGTTTGTIVGHGDQLLTVVDAPSPDGVLITADPAGGQTPATVSIENGGATLTLSAGDQLVATHGSVILNVVAGTVEATFRSDSGQIVGTASLPAGTDLTFKPDTAVFTAANTNTDPVTIVLTGGTAITVDAGQTFNAGTRTVAVNIVPEAINLDANGALTVFIYGAPDFNASQIVVASVLFAGAAPWQSALVDGNHDGQLDLQLKFRMQDIQTALLSVYSDWLEDNYTTNSSSTRDAAILEVTGELNNQLLFEGADSATLFLAGKSLRDLLGGLSS